jgi:hypothetical protein
VPVDVCVEARRHGIEGRIDMRDQRVEALINVTEPGVHPRFEARESGIHPLNGEVNRTEESGSENGNCAPDSRDHCTTVTGPAESGTARDRLERIGRF